MAEPKRATRDYPSNLYFKALDLPEGKVQDETMARRGAKLATLCRSAEALMRVAKTLRDSDRHGMAEDQLLLLMATVEEVEERADALVIDMQLVASNWRHRASGDRGARFGPGGWIPPATGAPVPPDGTQTVPSERAGEVVIKQGPMTCRVTPADFAATVAQQTRKARGLG